MGALQATSLLIRDKCDILIHINVDVPKYVPAYDRIRAFEDTCTEHNIPYELSLNVSGDSYNDLFSQMKVIFNNIDEKYPDKKKGVFLANDTYANMFLNLVIQKYGCLPDSYEIVGFDNSPIANEAIIPITDRCNRKNRHGFTRQADGKPQAKKARTRFGANAQKDNACADPQGDNQLVHRLCDMYQPNFLLSRPDIPCCSHHPMSFYPLRKPHLWFYLQHKIPVALYLSH